MTTPIRPLRTRYERPDAPQGPRVEVRLTFVTDAMPGELTEIIVAVLPKRLRPALVAYEGRSVSNG